VIGKLLVIDNYDRFVYNLVQYLGELGADPIVVRNDSLSIEELKKTEPDGVLISPGPGTPSDSGISMEAIRYFGSHFIPVLGVCLGHQCIGELYGGKVVRAREIMHGKTSNISHDGKGIFVNIPNPFEATRYHSLIVEPESVPEVLIVSATTQDGVIMGLRHKELPVEGVQFHPESIMTKNGHELIGNFLRQITLSKAEASKV
jgi:anthranilate synthase/aminodeoxychorismate synthase-like glutamine amidotransferase